MLKFIIPNELIKSRLQTLSRKIPKSPCNCSKYSVLDNTNKDNKKYSKNSSSSFSSSFSSSLIKKDGKTLKLGKTIKKSDNGKTYVKSSIYNSTSNKPYAGYEIMGDTKKRLTEKEIATFLKLSSIMIPEKISKKNRKAPKKKEVKTAHKKVKSSKKDLDKTKQNKSRKKKLYKGKKLKKEKRKNKSRKKGSTK